MTMSRSALRLVYGAIAAIALVGTWGNNIAYLNRGFVGANIQFWTDTFANPASRSITVDIFFLGLAVFVWMILEARRLQMRGVWLYFVVGIFVAISVTVPVFLINRDRAIAARDPQAAAGTLTPGDIVGLIAVTLTFIAYTAITLLRPTGAA